MKTPMPMRNCDERWESVCVGRGEVVEEGGMGDEEEGGRSGGQRRAPRAAYQREGRTHWSTRSPRTRLVAFHTRRPRESGRAASPASPSAPAGPSGLSLAPSSPCTMSVGSQSGTSLSVRGVAVVLAPSADELEPESLGGPGRAVPMSVGAEIEHELQQGQCRLSEAW